MSADGGDGKAISGTNEVTGFVTYAGGGFASVRQVAETGTHADPESASRRAYMREGLPAVYREGDFSMRFVEALEQVLDPIVAVLDMLAAHFDPRLAPLDILELITVWLGLQHNEAQPTEQLRDLVMHAAELGRLRGTRSGLELALRLNFPDLPLRLEDRGSVAWATTQGTLPDPEPPSFIVYCDKPIPADAQSEIARLIDEVKPVHVTYRLRVKAPKRQATPEDS